LTAFTVALTGGIGSGKSTVSALFGQLGIPIIDADQISHALTAPNATALADIAALFGDHLIDSQGALDRRALRSLVFDDPDARKRLENILHPRIRTEMQRQLEQSQGAYAILAIPLLFETGQVHLADRILVIDIPESHQIERVKRRSGLDDAQIRDIMASQVTRATRLAGADDIIDNRGSVADLKPLVEQLHRRYLQYAAQKASETS
jgi:dephospho-CoA kinase